MTIKLGITVSLTALVLFVLVPRLAAAAEAVTGLQELTAAERQQLVVTPAIGSSLLIAVIVLAVFKPPWRFRRAAEGSRR